MDHLLFIFSIFLFICVCLHHFIKKLKQKQLPDLPPGSTGWPFIGESLTYFSQLYNGVPENFATKRRNEYSSSKVFKTSLIGHKMAILGGAEGNKFLFSNENKLVQVWWPSSVDKIFPKSHNRANHDDFINVRKMFSSFLKPEALQKFVGTTDLVMKQHLQTYWDNFEEIKVSIVVPKYVFALSCRLILSIDDHEKLEELVKPVEEISRRLLSMAINFPGTPFNRAVKASKALREEMMGIIKQRKIEVLEKRASLATQDILSEMLGATDENGHFTNEFDIASYLVGLLNGSYGTVYAALTFVMKYLAEHSDVYDEVLREQMEIAKSKPSKELLNWEDLRKMRYSWNVVNEVLRLIPPIFGTFREAITDFTYAGHTIPRGWKLHWIANDTHKNPEYFPNPEKFDPLRFEGNGPAPYTFVPFGGGSRMCPGKEYTRMVILAFIHNVVMNYRWESRIPNEKVVYDPHPRPAEGLPIRLHRHNPNSLSSHHRNDA